MSNSVQAHPPTQPKQFLINPLTGELRPSLSDDSETEAEQETIQLRNSAANNTSMLPIPHGGTSIYELVHNSSSHFSEDSNSNSCSTAISKLSVGEQNNGGSSTPQLLGTGSDTERSRDSLVSNKSQKNRKSKANLSSTSSLNINTNLATNKHGDMGSPRSNSSSPSVAAMLTGGNVSNKKSKTNLLREKLQQGLKEKRAKDTGNVGVVKPKEKEQKPAVKTKATFNCCPYDCCCSNATNQYSCSENVHFQPQQSQLNAQQLASNVMQQNQLPHNQNQHTNASQYNNHNLNTQQPQQQSPQMQQQINQQQTSMNPPQYQQQEYISSFIFNIINRTIKPKRSHPIADNTNANSSTSGNVTLDDQTGMEAKQSKLTDNQLAALEKQTQQQMIAAAVTILPSATTLKRVEITKVERKDAMGNIEHVLIKSNESVTKQHLQHSKAMHSPQILQLQLELELQRRQHQQCQVLIPNLNYSQSSSLTNTLRNSPASTGGGTPAHGNSREEKIALQNPNITTKKTEESSDSDEPLIEVAGKVRSSKAAAAGSLDHTTILYQ
ncbi:hypothetical protein EVAR_101429_1 [Eumeta japonica]|uniref:Uncharacterized protein n=1 Tax=Eumeta variegata TaxID=151549 RepID=A0A4C1TS59_EUMVA|nr:hypothetical protein EVAR_101429_1 [Eumeta japonica]